MKPEYHEGPEALERFEKTMTALFRAPKTVTTKKETKRKARKRRTSAPGLLFVATDRPPSQPLKPKNDAAIYDAQHYARPAPRRAIPGRFYTCAY